jgi:hypothetical protein
MTATEETLLDAVIPGFPGFYNSELDSLMDREIEDAMENDGLTWEEADKRYDYQRARLAITQAWMNAFVWEFDIKLKFESIQSPREYNFTTDRLFVQLPLTEAERMAAVLKDADGEWNDSFKHVLGKMFTSYDGFYSFYPNNPNEGEWLMPLDQWDHNQMQALIAAYLYERGEADEPWRYIDLDPDRYFEAAYAGWVKGEEVP